MDQIGIDQTASACWRRPESKKQSFFKWISVKSDILFQKNAFIAKIDPVLVLVLQNENLWWLKKLAGWKSICSGGERTPRLPLIIIYYAKQVPWILDFGSWICIVFQTGDKRLLLIIICNFNKLPWSKKEETNLIQPWAVVGLKVGIDILELSRDQPSGNICFLKE